MLKSKFIFNIHAISLISLGAFLGGFLFSFWPLCLAGLLLSGAMGRYVTALVIGVCMDLLYGAPIGLLQFMHVPFTLLAFTLTVLHYYLSVYFRDERSDRL